MTGWSFHGQEKPGTRAFVGLGSNLGDRISHLRYGASALGRIPHTRVVGWSSVYDSPAHTTNTAPSGPDFLNAVLALRTRLKPLRLLDYLQEIEEEGGRPQTEKGLWTPRTLDLDLLIFGRRTIHDARLQVPHRQLGLRRFVLQPLAEVAPGLYVPEPYDASVETLLAECPDPDSPVKTEYTFR